MMNWDSVRQDHHPMAPDASLQIEDHRKGGNPVPLVRRHSDRWVTDRIAPASDRHLHLRGRVNGSLACVCWTLSATRWPV